MFLILWVPPTSATRSPEAFAFYFFPLPWSKHAQGHLTLYKDICKFILGIIWIKGISEFNTGTTLWEISLGSVCPGLLSTVLLLRLPTISCVDVFEHLLIIALLPTSVLLSSLGPGNHSSLQKPELRGKYYRRVGYIPWDFKASFRQQSAEKRKFS